MPRHIRLNAFDMACVGHIQHGMWTHPRDRSTDYTDLNHWMSLARTLERGLFDGLFLADVLGVYDVYQQSPDASLRSAVQIPLLDNLEVTGAVRAADVAPEDAARLDALQTAHPGHGTCDGASRLRRHLQPCV